MAHHRSASGFIALREAGREASRRGTDLAVIHVVESPGAEFLGHPDQLDRGHLDQDYREEISSEVERVLVDAGFPQLVWRLHLAAPQQTIADTVLSLTRRVDADVLVIGSQRRTLQADDLLGAVAQALIGQADVPVVVAKPAVPLSARR